MRRRNFIKLLGGAAAAWPLAARAQQPDRVRRVGFLNSQFVTDLEAQAWNAAFHRQLEELGWVDGRNIHIEYRWGAGSIERVQLLAKELVGLKIRTRLSPSLLPPPQHCRQKPTQSRLCLQWCPIRSATNSSQA